MDYVFIAENSLLKLQFHNIIFWGEMKKEYKCYYCGKKFPLVTDDIIIVHNGKYFSLFLL
jgi:hypothetical protein